MNTLLPWSSSALVSNDSTNLKAKLGEIYHKLRLDKKTLTLEEQKHKSAEDSRTSSKSMGVVAGVVLCVIPFLFVLSDCVKFIYKFKDINKTVKRKVYPC